MLSLHSAVAKVGPSLPLGRTRILRVSNMISEVGSTMVNRLSDFPPMGGKVLGDSQIVDNARCVGGVSAGEAVQAFDDTEKAPLRPDCSCQEK